MVRRASAVLEPPFFTFIPLPAFDLFRALEEPLYPLLPPHSPSPVPVLISYTLPPTRPLDHQTKLIHTFSASFCPALPPSTSPFRYPTPHQRNDRLRCTYVGGRPALYEVTTHLRADFLHT